jgi:hypothetical protein
MVDAINQLPIAPIRRLHSGYGHLTQKSTMAFLYAYQHHIDEFDWFIKADDDTYLIIDNLRAFLNEQNASEPVTFGYNFKVGSVYCSFSSYSKNIADESNKRDVIPESIRYS